MKPLVLAACAVALLAGCSSGAPTESQPASSGPSPGVAATQPPAMPSPQEIDDTWRIDDEPEVGEQPVDGAAGSWVASRDPAELVWGLGALGCPQTVGPAAYPLPVDAMQARYRTADGSAAVGLRLRFEQATDAGALLAAMGRDAVGCIGPAPVTSGPYERRYEVERSTPDALDMSFREYGSGASNSTWHVLGARSDARVGIFFVEERPGTPIRLPDPRTLLSP